MSLVSATVLAETTPSLESFVRRTRLARELRPGATLGRFQIVRRLGMGAMGVVFEAHDPELDRGVALKVLFDEEEGPSRGEAGLRDTTRSARLVQEARSMAKLTHPNAVAAYQIGVDTGRVFLAMELVDGTTLKEWLEARPSPAEVVRLFQQVSYAVDAAHRAGIIHRDLKPQNILVTREGQPKVTDFGLAGASATAPAQGARAPVGTPAYMAPEVWRGEHAGPEADQFSLAVCVHEALSGRRPYSASTPAELRAVMLAGTAEAIDRTIAAPLRVVLARALAHDRTARYPTVEAFGSALARAGAAGRDRRWASAVGAASVVAIASAALLLSRGASTTVTSKEPSESVALSTPTLDTTIAATVRLVDHADEHAAEGPSSESTTPILPARPSPSRRQEAAPAAPAAIDSKSSPTEVISEIATTNRAAASRTATNGDVANGGSANAAPSDWMRSRR